MIPKIPEYGFQAIPLSPDDHLQIEHLSYSSGMSMILEGTALNDKGILIPFRFEYESKLSLTRIIFHFRLGYSALVSLTLRTSSLVIPSGDCYCVVTLVKAITGSEYPQRQVLLNGYVETHVPLSFMNSYVQPNLNDHFFVQTIAVPDPAPGAQLTFPCPDFTLLEIISFQFDLVSDATVINRLLRFRLYYGLLYTGAFGTTAAATAGTTRGLLAYNGNSTNLSSIDGHYYVPLPSLILQPGYQLQTNTSNLQAGDQITNCTINVKRKTIPI